MMKTTSSITAFVKNNKAGLVIIAIAWLIFFSRTLFMGQIYFLDDLKIIYYPLEQEYAHFQDMWQLPQWSTVFGFGHPLIAWGQLGFLTPLHLILRLGGVPPLILLQISILAYFAWGLLGMYLFMRRRLYSQPASALGASLFVFTGFSIGHLNHVNFYTSTMFIPWLLLAGAALLERPTLRRTAILALVASIITLSGQPQVALFSYVAVAGVLLGIAVEKYFPLWGQKVSLKPLYTSFSLTILAGILALALASFSILPLFEFLPTTERNDALPQSELLEFSYPPLHAITLIFPYFFGDHDTYWGAKGFQELAAFTGIIPLILAGIAFFRWKNHKPERVAGLFFIALALSMALGRYSTIYTFLVEHHYVTSLGVAGRFVFFFVIGIMLLAPNGLDDIAAYVREKKLIRIIPLLGGIVFTSIILSGFFIAAQSDAILYDQLIYKTSLTNPAWICILLGLLIIPLYALSAVFPKVLAPSQYILSIIAIATLVGYGWNYNPVTPYKNVQALSPFVDTLRAAETHNIPARLYSREDLVQTTLGNAPKRKTDAISPTFSVYQPFTTFSDSLNCLLVEMGVEKDKVGSITVGLHEDPRKDPITFIQILSEDITAGQSKVCFPSVPVTQNQTYWLSFTSNHDSGIFLEYQFTDQDQFKAYFSRKKVLTDEQWKRSQKEAFVTVVPDITSGTDRESILLARHLNVIANSSSARWIGALSIRQYREFIEFFFANDSEFPVDGDGLHVIQKYRKFVNLAGITHLAQTLPLGKEDGMPKEGYEQVGSMQLGQKEARLYKNPAAAPKAFLVPSAIWKSAPDETRAEMRFDTYDPFTTAYLGGPTPPQSLPNGTTEQLQGKADIEVYEPAYVRVKTFGTAPSVLVVSDSTTPQWLTYIDGQPASRFVAYSIFKAAIVPAGEHTVEFKYESPAIAKAKILTLTSFIFIIALLLIPVRRTENISN